MKQLDQLVSDHFASLGSLDTLDFGDGYSRLFKPSRFVAALLVGLGLAKWRHVNYFTFLRLFEEIDRTIARPVILETGSSAHGTNSSLLFATLAEQAEGIFDTVDINPSTVERIRVTLRDRFGASTRLHCHQGDSVDFIRAFDGEPPNIAYLDSFDLDPPVFEQSARHGMLEFEALLPKLSRSGALILVDDTPCSRDFFSKMRPADHMPAVDAYVATTGHLPGKGSLILEAVRRDRRFQLVDWQYQVLLRYTP